MHYRIDYMYSNKAFYKTLLIIIGLLLIFSNYNIFIYENFIIYSIAKMARVKCQKNLIRFYWYFCFKNVIIFIGA